MKIFILLLLLLLGLSSCRRAATPKQSHDRYAHIADHKIRNILIASIGDAGGLDQWNSIQDLQYTKNFSLYNSDGSIEKSVQQTHDYIYFPLELKITSIENQDTIVTQLKLGKYSRTKNGKLADTSQTDLAKSINTSTYVIGMPYKLLDEGARLTYLGRKVLDSGSAVDIIQASYNPSNYKNHSSDHTWRYYFDTDNARIVACWVDAGDHYSLVENISFKKVNGFLLFDERKSYRIDSSGNKLYLRADYKYGNYKINNKSRASMEMPFSASWLIGSWIRENDQEGRQTYEYWAQAADNTYAGLGYTIEQSDTIFKEILAIKPINDKWHLIVAGVNQDSTYFPIALNTSHSFTAINPDNPFPKDITYYQDGASLKVNISDDRDTIPFVFRRIP